MKRPYSVQLELMSMVTATLYEQMKGDFDLAEVDKLLQKLEELTNELELVARMSAKAERVQREGKTQWRIEEMGTKREAKSGKRVKNSRY